MNVRPDYVYMHTPPYCKQFDTLQYLPGLELRVLDTKTALCGKTGLFGRKIYIYTLQTIAGR